jgi:hypothetical protein
MTRPEWESCPDPRRLLRAARGVATERQMRL